MIRTDTNYIDTRIDLSKTDNFKKNPKQTIQTKVQRILKINETEVCSAGNIKFE